MKNQAAILSWILLLPSTAFAEAGMGGLWLIGIPFVIAMVFGAPVLLVWFIWRSIRNGKNEGHDEYKNKEASRAPLGRLGE